MRTSRFFLNLLLLAALTGTVLFGWLAGHILRYSIPAHQFRHPPVPEFDLHIKNGNQLEGENELFVFTQTENARVRVFVSDGQADSPERCVTLTYYTSLPAKCHMPDGRLVQVGGAQAVTQALP